MTEEDDATSFILGEIKDLPCTHQPPMTPERIYAALANAERSKKRILVHPSRLEEFERTVYGAGLGLHFRVEPHPCLEPDQAYLMASEAELEADMQATVKRAGAKMLEAMREQLRADVERIRADLEDEARAEREREYLRAVYSISRPNWLGIITGL